MASGTCEAHGTAPAPTERPPALRTRVRRSVEAHLGSPDVAHIIYGAIIRLALAEAPEKPPPPGGATAATLVGTAIAVGLAEAYSELVAADARTHRPADRQRLRLVARESSAVVFGAGFPAAFFVLAAARVIPPAAALPPPEWARRRVIVGLRVLGARASG